MPGVKISELPAATTPLDGTELLPVVQSGVTVQTTFDDIPFLQAGAGAVNRTVQSKLRDMSSTDDYGGSTSTTASTVGGLTSVSTNGETATNFGFLQLTRPLYYSDTTAFQERRAVINLRREITAPTTVVPMTWTTAIGQGDNASVIGVSGGFVDVRDSQGITSSQRGVLYGFQITAAPRFARNNIPYDDVSCLVLQHNGTVPGANGTDALYIGTNSTYFPGSDQEWITGMTVRANVGYGHRTTGTQFTGFNASGKMRGESGDTYGFFADGEIQSTATGNAYLFRSIPTVINSTFTCAALTHFSAAQGAIGASATVSNQYGFRVSSSMTGATNNFGFRSDITSASGNWAFYESGGAQSYFAGRVIVGSAATAVSNAQGVSGNFQMVGGGVQTTALLGRYTNDANGAAVSFAKSRSTTVGGHSVVSDGDTLGTLAFEGNDGDQLHRAATVAAQIDGTAANNSMPGRLVFSTTSSGSTSPAERMRIDSNGNVISNVAASAPTLSTNRTMVFNLTSDTNLRISVRGSDGVTRTANITLA